VQGLFGCSQLQRDYYHHAGKQAGHYPVDAALGLEGGYTPALAKLVCLEGADEPTYLKAERHLGQTGGIAVSARQIQRVVQRVGAATQKGQEREAQPGACDGRYTRYNVAVAGPVSAGRFGEGESFTGQNASQ